MTIQEAEVRRQIRDETVLAHVANNVAEQLDNERCPSAAVDPPTSSTSSTSHRRRAASEPAAARPELPRQSEPGELDSSEVVHGPLTYT
jgi:L-fucose isomerase-like protein